MDKVFGEFKKSNSSFYLAILSFYFFISPNFVLRSPILAHLCPEKKSFLHGATPQTAVFTPWTFIWILCQPLQQLRMRATFYWATQRGWRENDGRWMAMGLKESAGHNGCKINLSLLRGAGGEGTPSRNHNNYVCPWWYFIPHGQKTLYKSKQERIKRTAATRVFREALSVCKRELGFGTMKAKVKVERAYW